MSHSDSLDRSPTLDASGSLATPQTVLASPQQQQMSELTEILSRHCPSDQDGFFPSPIDGVTLVHSENNYSRRPLIYQPALIVIAQGNKVGYLGDKTYQYNSGNYLLQTLPLPFECETFADSSAPLYGIHIRLDFNLLREISEQMSANQNILHEHPKEPMASIELSPSISSAILQLARTLADPQSVAVMGQARMREVMFELLRDPRAYQLCRQMFEHHAFSRVLSALNHLHDEYAQPLNVSQLAESANMSLSGFHQHFKKITHTSPLQYLKRIRLLKAQQLLFQGTDNVSTAAIKVGYDSTSQFSREYKRYFGETPRESMHV